MFSVKLPHTPRFPKQNWLTVWITCIIVWSSNNESERAWAHAVWSTVCYCWYFLKLTIVIMKRPNKRLNAWLSDSYSSLFRSEWYLCSYHSKNRWKSNQLYYSITIRFISNASTIYHVLKRIISNLRLTTCISKIQLNDCVVFPCLAGLQVPEPFDLLLLLEN